MVTLTPSIINKFISEFTDSKKYDAFTKLFQNKIVGAILSKNEYLKENIHELEGIVDISLRFKCPKCDEIILTNEDGNYSCDCGYHINVASVNTEKRYLLNDDFFELITNILSQKISLSNETFVICFGEKKKSYLKYTGEIILHITPFPIWENFNDEILLLDEAYVTHFLLPWNLLPTLLIENERNKLFDRILNLRKSIVKKQIDWNLIDGWGFEKLSFELLEKEKTYDKLVPGGKGPDQGKDGYGYYSLKLPTGRFIQIKTLIQCKYTLSGISFNYEKINSYVSRAKQHGCNSLLFITNGSLSGDAVTAVESSAFKEKDFDHVDFFDSTKMINLLEKHGTIRSKYFDIKK